MQGQSVGLQSPSLYSSGFCDVNFTSAAAVGGCGDDVLCGGLLIGRLLLQMFGVGLGCALRNGLFGVQLSLTLGDNVVCLQDREENVFRSTNRGSAHTVRPCVNQSFFPSWPLNKGNAEACREGGRP